MKIRIVPGCIEQFYDDEGNCERQQFRQNNATYWQDENGESIPPMTNFDNQPTITIDPPDEYDE